jgi:hypothetical protein
MGRFWKIICAADKHSDQPHEENIRGRYTEDLHRKKKILVSEENFVLCDKRIKIITIENRMGPGPGERTRTVNDMEL